MKAPDCIVVDFETDAIQSRPNYPPKPNSVAIKWPQEKKGRFYSWGQNGDNNCSKADANRALSAAWKSNLPLLFQHGKFDIDLAEMHFNLQRLPWERIH